MRGGKKGQQQRWQRERREEEKADRQFIKEMARSLKDLASEALAKVDQGATGSSGSKG